MTDFNNAVDIANRALQHLGQTRIDANLGFTEDSKAAGEISFCYNKLREAELRRNVWRFAIRDCPMRPISLTTMLMAPLIWQSTTTYYVGSLVTDETGTWWISRLPNNLNMSPGLPAAWELYCGPRVAQLWDSSVSYYPGDVVYASPLDGTYRVFLTLANVTTGSPQTDPRTTDAWLSTVTYRVGQVVSYLSTNYQSNLSLNAAQIPSASPAEWLVGTTYAATNQVQRYGTIYTSVGSGNVGLDPALDGGVHWTPGGQAPWTTTIVRSTASGQFQELSVVLTDVSIPYPVGLVVTQTQSLKNIFMLPANFLREAPSDPKAGGTTLFGAPTGLAYTDHVYENDYITSMDAIFMLRFSCDHVDVSRYDPMFCEGLGCRIAIETCETITQSKSLINVVESKYTKFMSEARIVNGIETGPTEPAEDDYVSCRY